MRTPHTMKLLVPVLLALALAGCGGDSEDEGTDAGAAKAVTVDVRDFKFGPPAVTVSVGARVTFVNRDKAPHTAQTDLGSRSAEFDTGRLERGDRRSVTLRDPGRFGYFCALHPFMKGTVRVVE